MSNRIPTSELRAELHAAGISPAELARRLRWTRPYARRARKPDAARVRRTLGIKPDADGRVRVAVNPPTARRIRRALAVPKAR